MNALVIADGYIPADDNCLLFVKNLPDDVTKEMLAEVFSDAKDVRLPLNAEGNFRG